MKKRRLVTLGWLVLLMIFLTGCGAKKRNSLLQDAADDINC